LEAVDRWLPNLDLREGDMLILTADHGCDPTTPSTDHSREYTPLLVYGQHVRADVALGTRGSLSDIGATVAENFRTTLMAGKSFLADIEL
jgi:phosphopentomutase